MKKHFISVFAVALMCGQFQLYGQSDILQKQNGSPNKFLLDLSVVQNSLASHTSEQHTYMLKVVNVFDKDFKIKIVSDNVSCQNINKADVVFQQQVYWSETGGVGSTSKSTDFITIHARGILELYVKLIRPANTILNSWNCTEVKAVGEDGNNISNTVLLESFIPDPKDFR